MKKSTRVNQRLELESIIKILSEISIYDRLHNNELQEEYNKLSKRENFLSKKVYK